MARHSHPPTHLPTHTISHTLAHNPSGALPPPAPLLRQARPKPLFLPDGPPTSLSQVCTLAPLLLLPLREAAWSIAHLPTNTHSFLTLPFPVHIKQNSSSDTPSLPQQQQQPQPPASMDEAVERVVDGCLRCLTPAGPELHKGMCVHAKHVRRLVDSGPMLPTHSALNTLHDWPLLTTRFAEQNSNRAGGPDVVRAAQDPGVLWAGAGGGKGACVCRAV